MCSEIIPSRRSMKIFEKKCTCERDFEAILKILTDFLLRKDNADCL